MIEAVVVAAYGSDWVEQCTNSLSCDPVLVLDTADGGHPTGAYLRAYEMFPDVDRFLFVQDSMTCLVGDPRPWFRGQWPGSGAVAWQRFPMQWDAGNQQEWVESHYPGVPAPSHGIFGPVFYTDRASLDLLAGRGLLPLVPTSRWEAQATERAWAYAFAGAGLPVVGPEWQPHDLVAGNPVGPFRKVFAGRP